MIPSLVTRDVIHLTICASFVLLVTMVTRAVDGGKGKCPSGKFGRHCRLTCHCQDDADCDDVTGKCPRACMEGWSGPHCQRQNVVLGMPTDMKTPDWSKGARAVDGDVKTCVTSSSNRTGWWRVDMLVERTVFFMEILFANQTARPGRMRVHVSDYVDTFWGKPCTRIPVSHKRSKFSCDLPSAGRYFGIINKQGQITLCEVFVFVCTPFTFGVDCSQECACADPTELCNAVTGSCTTGCRDGYTGSSCIRPCRGRYGRACRNPCGHCYNGEPCDHVTGLCHQGCAPGWSGPWCKQGCEPGTYGIDCLNRCQHCLDNATCEPENGVCPWRCESGWQGHKCDTECEPGRHGQSCEFSCGNCYGLSVCDRHNGVCPIGCDAGYEGLFCTKECIPGKWGPNCQYACGHCVNTTCSRSSGECDEHGCQIGWYGSKCEGACQPGTFGRNCVQKCGHCQSPCDVIDGSCHSQCLPGWEGRSCVDKCSNKTYGTECSLVCGQCASDQPCHYITGHCPNLCKEGYKLPLCHIRAETLHDQLGKPNLVTLLVCCMTVFICTITGVFTWLLVRWRRDNVNVVVDTQNKRETLYKQTVV